MTTLYFIRHAEPNFNNHNDSQRELSAKGQRDTALVTHFLLDKNVSTVLSSPFKRAVDTVKPFADAAGLSVAMVDNFRERKVGGS